MFTGIIESTAKVLTADHHDQWLTLVLAIPSEQLEDLQIGASISVNGVCLTVTKGQDTNVHFDIIAESLARTTLRDIAVGDTVNIERSLKQGGEIGGHPISGHVDGTAEIIKLEQSEGNYVLRFKVEDHIKPYIFNKGFIAIDGISLTAGMVNKSTGEFTVWFIPETLRRTNIGKLQVGDLVNIEINRETQERVDTIMYAFEQLLGSGVQSEKFEEVRNKLLGLE